MKRLSLLILLYFNCTCLLRAQEFLNGDLSGIITGISSLPANWLNVPFNDVNCLSNSAGSDSPDLTSLLLPTPSAGIIGNPYSGSTFISGVHDSISGLIFHEGIMQTISGFIPGNNYTINFHQAVVKQINLLDSSGSWMVYIDTTLAGITLPTTSNAPFNSTSFVWEFRSVSFVATDSSHTIKFLPWDNDSLWMAPLGLRMGIDCIFIFNGCDSINTGISDIIFHDSFKIYPNPMTDKFEVKSDSYEPLEVLLYDMSSKVLMSQKFVNSVSLKTEHLASGMYIYEIRNRNGVIKKGKVVK